MQKWKLGFVAAVSSVMAACGSGAVPDDTQPDAPTPTDVSAPPASADAAADNEPGTGAMVLLAPTVGNQAQGRLILVEEDAGTRIRGEVTGLTPNGEHGFHVHESGDCSAPDAESAGEHLNPAGHPHGNPSTGLHHAGDMLNLRADGQGNATVDVMLAALTVGGGLQNDVIGKAVIVHAAADDYSSQPAGNSGARIACGVIE